MAGSKRGRGRRNDIPWQAIREAYASGDTETASLARKFGCSERAIRNRRNAEHWPTNAEIISRAANKVVDIKTRQALESVGEAVEKALAEELVISSRLRVKMAKVIEDLADGVTSGKYQPSSTPATRDMAQFAKDTMGAYHTYLSTLRDDLGRLKGTPTVEDEEGKKRPTLTRFVIVDQAESA